MSVIFINYRRDDSAITAFWLYERLSKHFGSDRVFLDLKIGLGDDFVESVNQAIGVCKVLIAVIGPDWLSILKDREGNNNDYVRLEIETALKNNIRVIPVLSPKAKMPTQNELPPSISRLSRLNALILTPVRLNEDIQILIDSIDQKIIESKNIPVARNNEPQCPNIGGYWIRGVDALGKVFFKQNNCRVVGIYVWGNGNQPTGVFIGQFQGNEFEFKWHWFSSPSTMKGVGRLAYSREKGLLTGFWTSEDSYSGIVPLEYVFQDRNIPDWVTDEDFEQYLYFLRESDTQ